MSDGNNMTTSQTPANPSATVSIAGEPSGISLSPDAKAHIDDSVEKRALKYAAIALSGSVLFVLGVIFNSIWGLNERASRTEGRVLEQSSYVETLKLRIADLEKQKEQLLRQLECMSKKGASIQECFHVN
jgi:hypothetical protein